MWRKDSIVFGLSNDNAQENRLVKEGKKEQLNERYY